MSIFKKIFSWRTLLIRILSNRLKTRKKLLKTVLLVIPSLFLSIYFIVWSIKGDIYSYFIHSDNQKASHIEQARENEKDSIDSYIEMMMQYRNNNLIERQKKERNEGIPKTYVYTSVINHKSRLDTVIPYVSAKDSAWIKVLNQIPVDVDPSDIKYNLYFRMQLPEDIDIVMRYIECYIKCKSWWNAEDNVENTLVACLYDYHTGKNYLYKNTYGGWFTKESGALPMSSYSEDKDEDRDGDVHYLNCEWSEDPYVINDNAAFQLLDIDFDGEKELLVNGCDFCRDGNMQFIYRLKGNRIVPADDLPFNYVRCFTVDFDPNREKISFSQGDAWGYTCFFLTKTNKPTPIPKKPVFKTFYAETLWDEFDFSKNKVFVLDSIYEKDEICDSNWENCINSAWEYKRFGKDLRLVKSRKMKKEQI